MVFQFEHMDLDSQPGKDKWALKPLHLPDLKASLSRWQNGLHGQGWNSLYWNNHDQPRIVSRFGDNSARYRERSAKMLATCLHFMQGTPYIYQGEELGMTNVAWSDIADYQDIETRNMYRVATQERGLPISEVMQSIHTKGRDNARTPMQWNAAQHGGFTTGTPWIAANANHATLNAERATADADSLFHYYQQLIALRRTNALITDGRYRLLQPDHPHLFAYLREDEHQSLLVLCNFSSGALQLPLIELPDISKASALIGNLPVDQWGTNPGTLEAWEARVYLCNPSNMAS
jgi:glycosidase